MSSQEITIQRLADAVQLSKYQIEAWISRGHFKPENPVESGKRRAFTFHDALILGTLAEFSRLGLPGTVTSMHVAHLHGFHDDDSLFVICQGPARLAPGVESTNLEGEVDVTFARNIPAREIGRIIGDPTIRAFAVVNLNQIENRVRSSLGMN
jgi:hypothetical protein